MSLDAADLALFVDPDMPGYALAASTHGDIPGLFDNAYADALQAYAGTAPSFFCIDTDAAKFARGDALTINGVAYTLQKPAQPDGNGFARLVLQKS